MSIVLPDGACVPAVPGKFQVVPPPDLNAVDDSRFVLEYDYPFRIVRAMVERPFAGAEELEVSRQAGNWLIQHPRIGGIVGGSSVGYLFNGPRSSRLGRTRGSNRQFIPDVSYINQPTWSHLTLEEKQMGFLPCKPTVVIDRSQVCHRQAGTLENQGQQVHPGW